MKKLIALVPMLLMLAILTQAQERTPRANAREAAQRERIHAGRQSGEVTNREAVALNAEQRHIQRSERRAKVDGDVTLAERRKLDRKQDRANRHIRRARHNAAVKP